VCARLRGLHWGSLRSYSLCRAQSAARYAGTGFGGGRPNVWNWCRPNRGGGGACRARAVRARFAGCMKRSPPLNFWSASDMLLVCDSRRLRPPNAPPRRACILHLYKPGSRVLLVTLSEEFDVPRTCNSATDCSMRAGHWLTKPQDRVAPVRLVRLIRTLSSDS